MGKWSTYRRRGSSKDLGIVGDFVARVVSGGGTVSAGTQTVLNTLVVSLINAGLWDLMYEVWPCSGGGLAAAMAKLKWAPGAPSSWDNTGFVIGDYNPTGGSGGLHGDAATKWLGGGSSQAQLGLNCHVFTWAAAVTAAAGNRWFGGSIDAGDQYVLGSISGVASTDGRLAGTTNATTAAAMAAGDWCVSRLANNDLALYKNGASVGTSATVTTAAASAQRLALFAALSSGSAVGFSDARLTGHTSGLGLTAGQVASLHTIWGTFNTSLSR